MYLGLGLIMIFTLPHMHISTIWWAPNVSLILLCHPPPYFQICGDAIVPLFTYPTLFGFYFQGTFLGRYRHFLDIIDPRTLFTTKVILDPIILWSVVLCLS